MTGAALSSFVRRRWLVLVVALILVAAGTVAAVAVVHDGGDGTTGSKIDPEDLLDERQLDLIRKAEPDPGCDQDPGPAPGDESLVALDVMRVDGSCLTVTTEYLPADQVEARRVEVERDPAVVVAAVAPPAFADAEDDLRDDQWPLDVLGAPEGSDELPWPDGRGVVVAVVDTGIDSSHPDLAGAVVARRNFEGQGALDEDGHGTHVAGIVGARSGNGGIVGVAPGVSILDVPVALGERNQRGPSWFVGLGWAVNHGADVANLSLGASLAYYEQPEHREALELAAATIEFARDNEVVVVASAGNCGSWLGDCDQPNQRQVPALFSSVVSVGAVQSDMDLAGYSTRNDDVDLVAPGGGDVIRLVLSTYPGGKYEPLSGTSQAAPHVAAAAAIGRFVNPEATADEVSRALLDTADRDRVSEGDRNKVGVGRGFLDVPGAVAELRGQLRPPEDLADRTQVAYVHEGALFAYDGDSSRPIRTVPPGAGMRWVGWSNDHSFLVGADDRTLFSWAGPGTPPVEKPCDWCADETSGPAFVEDAAVTDPVEGQPSGDLVLRIAPDGTLTRYDAHTLDPIGWSRPSFPADSVGSKSLHGAVGGRLIVHESGGAQAAERLWLVDPVSGEVGRSHDVAGSVQRVAVNASNDRFAVVTGYSSCGQPEGVHVLDNELGDIAAPAPPPGEMFDELFFDGETLYAAMSAFDVIPDEGCKRIAQAGLWRLDGDTWSQVDPFVATARPLEGRPAETQTGWFVIKDGVASLDPAAGDDPDHGDLGAAERPLWSTPTRTEVGKGEPAGAPPPAPPGQAEPADPAIYRGQYDIYHFVSPSGRFRCGISAPDNQGSFDAGCQGPTEPIPAKPATCQLSWGDGIEIANTGQVSFTCIGGLTYGDRSAPVLPYGRSLSAHGYTCTSAETGVRCVHDATGHGFRIARQSNELF